ncbi:hypothetical protein HDV63DRAFT_350725 [Trichoderma sp. SZMC 28014]
MASPSSLLPFFFLLQLPRAAAPSLPHAPLGDSGFSPRRKCPYRYCQVRAPAAQRRRAAGTACDAVLGEHVVQRLTADMTCLLPPTAANSHMPPPTQSLLLFSRHRPPVQRTDSLAAARISSGHGCALLFAFCWCRPSPARPSPVYHLAPSPNPGVPGELLYNLIDAGPRPQTNPLLVSTVSRGLPPGPFFIVSNPTLDPARHIRRLVCPAPTPLPLPSCLSQHQHQHQQLTTTTAAAAAASIATASASATLTILNCYNTGLFFR